MGILYILLPLILVPNRRSGRGHDNLVYAGEYCKCCDACQAAVTAAVGGDAALKFDLERLTIGYVIGDGVGRASAARLKALCLLVLEDA